MKTKLFFVLLTLGVISTTYSQEIQTTTATKVVQNLLNAHSLSRSIEKVQVLKHQNQPLGYCFMLHPKGYTIISANKNIRPVIAYSFQSDITQLINNPLISVIKQDLENRTKALEFYTEQQKSMNREEWDQNLTQQRKKVTYFPPLEETKGEGFLETNWHQNHPYNLLCPMDLQTGNRSVVGCPATTMSQILHYHKEINDVLFTDDDDYYHNYTNNFYIDDDFEDYDFPSFPELNIYLDSLRIDYSNETTPSDTEIAALNFACGVAATQVYSSTISGTYGVNQAYEAYQKFGFELSELLENGDTSINTRLVENMQYELPAHLALVDPNWSVGHNVVIDGYNTDNYFHLDFGWGGSNNGWYTMPPTNIPYNLTVIEGVVVDINIDTTASPPPPVATDFTASNTTILQGQSIGFTDLSTGEPTEWEWTFEGATPATSTLQNPANINFDVPGQFSVTLVARNAFTSDSITKESYISVSPNQISEKNKDEIEVYPSPANEFLHFKIPHGEMFSKAVVYNITGKIVKTYEQENISKIHVKNLVPGLYFCKLYLENRIITRKFTK